MSVGRVHAAERRREDGDAGARQGRSATATTSPLAGILRIIPIERMNALLVITPQPAYLDEAKKWIDAPRPAAAAATARASTSTTCRTSAPRSSGRCCSRRSRAARRRPRRRRRRRSRPARRPARSSIPPTFQPQPAVVAADGHVTPAAPAAATPGAAPAARPRRGRRGHRHRAQPPGRRRQGQQHAADRRHAAPSTR